LRAGDAAVPWPALAVPTTSRCARFAQRLKIGAELKVDWCGLVTH